MSGFTKLVPEIIQSSMWNESSDVRIVWITMLAIKDESGYVQGNEKTLARLANVSLDSVTEALQVFLGPDSSSKTPDNEGRRVAPAAGGYIVLNSDIYRAHDDVKREQTRLRVKRHREKMKEKDDNDNGNATVTLPSASASASVSIGINKGTKRGSLVSHGEFGRVRLSKDEMDRLVAAHGDSDTLTAIEFLDTYIEQKGNKYKNHYAAMKADSWVWERVAEKKDKADVSSKGFGE